MDVAESAASVWPRAEPPHARAAASGRRRGRERAAGALALLSGCRGVDRLLAGEAARQEEERRRAAKREARARDGAPAATEGCGKRHRELLQRLGADPQDFVVAQPGAAGRCGPARPCGWRVVHRAARFQWFHNSASPCHRRPLPPRRTGRRRRHPPPAATADQLEAKGEADAEAETDTTETKEAATTPGPEPEPEPETEPQRNPVWRFALVDRVVVDGTYVAHTPQGRSRRRDEAAIAGVEAEEAAERKARAGRRASRSCRRWRRWRPERDQEMAAAAAAAQAEDEETAEEKAERAAKRRSDAVSAALQRLEPPLRRAVAPAPPRQLSGIGRARHRGGGRCWAGAVAPGRARAPRHPETPVWVAVPRDGVANRDGAIAGRRASSEGTQPATHWSGFNARLGRHTSVARSA